MAPAQHRVNPLRHDLPGMESQAAGFTIASVQKVPGKVIALSPSMNANEILAYNLALYALMIVGFVVALVWDRMRPVDLEITWQAYAHDANRRTRR